MHGERQLCDVRHVLLQTYKSSTRSRCSTRTSRCIRRQSKRSRWRQSGRRHHLSPTRSPPLRLESRDVTTCHQLAARLSGRYHVTSPPVSSSQPASQVKDLQSPPQVGMELRDVITRHQLITRLFGRNHVTSSTAPISVLHSAYTARNSLADKTVLLISMPESVIVCVTSSASLR